MACLLIAACSDGTTPVAAPSAAQGPHVLRWAPGAAPRFEAVGAVADGSGWVGDGSFASLVQAAPVAVDWASSAAANAASLSWSHTVGTGANRFLVVGVSIVKPTQVVTGVTYAGQAMAFLGARNHDKGDVRVEMWYLNSPPSGTATVSVKLAGAAKMVAGATSFTGVDPVEPLGTFVSAGSDDGNTDAIVTVGNAADGMVLSAVAAEGSAGTLTPASGQTSRYVRFQGTAGGDVAGGASTASGASSITMRWKKGDAEWVIGGVVLRRAPVLAVSVSTYQASFWAKRGQSRSIQINYLSGGSNTPFLRFTATDPTYVPGRGYLAMGDSVLITVRVDSTMVAAHFEPSGTQFGTASSLTLWYGGVGGDLNGDGVVNTTDATIESQLLGMWYRDNAVSAWTPIPSTRSLSEKWFSTPIAHFSDYAVSW